MPKQTASARRMAQPGKRKKPDATARLLSGLLFFSLFCAIFIASALIGSLYSPNHRLPHLPFFSAPSAPAPVFQAPPAPLPGMANPQAKVTEHVMHPDGVPMILVEGGIAGSFRSPHREGILQFVHQTGAAAGLNGTFFANASLDGTDNLLIGPSLCRDETRVVKGPFDHRMQLAGRPVVLISPTRTRFVAYNPRTMDSNAAIHALLPGVTDEFLGGVWLVHNGKAASKQRIMRFKVLDANDPRVRAFFGIMNDGRPFLGATTWVVNSIHLAKALQIAGVREATLLDSGFSTSLVWKDKILVTGHTSPGIPSRPVPHALVLFAMPEVAKSPAAPATLARDADKKSKAPVT